MTNNLVSMADIARLAEVERAAVSNWRRRSSGFPEPVNTTGRERFVADDVAAWLDRRRIPASSLKNDEPVESTYGARFRRNAEAMEPDDSPRVSAPEASAGGRDFFEGLWRALERHRGFVSIYHYRSLVLGLLYLRVLDTTLWSELISASMTGNPPQLRKTLVAAAGKHQNILLDNLSSTPLGSQEEATRTAEVVRILDRVPIQEETEGTVPVAGRLFDFLLERFATAEGLKGAEYYTPESVVRTMLEVIELVPGESVHDPCCGSGNLLTGAVDAVRRSSGDVSYTSVSGYALAEESRAMAAMGLYMHGVDANLGAGAVHALEDDDDEQEFDAVLSNPPFNIKNWSRKDPSGDPRWRYGVPPGHNANFAWLQHALAKLVPGGRAAVLMSNGATFQGGIDGKIRAAMIEAGVVESIVALPPRLFHSTGIPVSIWLLRKSTEKPHGKLLLVDATGMGRMVGRTRRALDDAEIEWIGNVHREFREIGEVPESDFCRAVPLAKIREREYLLNPRSYLADSAASVDPTSALGAAREHHRGLAALARREREADTEVERQLERVGLWTPLGEGTSATWERVSLEEVCDVLPGPGGVLRDIEHDAEGVPILAPKNIHGNRIVDAGVDRVPPGKAEQKLSKYRLAAGDVLCVRTGDPGRTAYVDAEHAGALFGTSCLRLRPKETVLTGRYLTYWLGTPPARDWIDRNTVGATVPSLNARMLRSMPVSLPSLQVQVAIGEILRSLDDKIELHEKIGRATAELRDSLAALLGTGTFPLGEQHD